MFQGKPVFVVAYVSAGQIASINALEEIHKANESVDQVVVLSDTTSVIEAASIRKLSAYETEVSAASFNGAIRFLNESDEIFLDESNSPIIVWLNINSWVLSPSELERGLNHLNGQPSLSLFVDDIDKSPLARIFVASDARLNADLIASDIAWFDLQNDELHP